MDEHHFTHGPEEEDGGTWSTPEEERTFRSIRDLLMQLRDRGSGIYIRPVRQDERYGVDGWVVGESSANGEQDLAMGPWLEQVVEAARAAAR